MNFFIGLALKNRTMRVFGDGAQVRNVNYVSDVVDALVLAGQSDRSTGEVYFAAADQHLSVAAIAEAIQRNIGGKVQYVEWPTDRESIEIGNVFIDNHKIRNGLGWTPQVDIDNGLQQTGEYFRQCLNKYLD